MKLILYNNYSENNRVNKSNFLNKIVEIEGYLREQTSLINPQIIIEFDPELIENYIDRKFLIIDDFNRYVIDDNDNIVIAKYKIKSDILSSNYVYIPDFNRYYFINDITSVRQNLWRLSLHVDVLMSYKNEINNTNAFISRNEFKYDLDIYDRELPTKQDISVEFETIENDLIDNGSDPNLYQYVVTTITST